MRILIVTDTYHPDVNGSSYFTQRLAKYLKSNNHDVAVIAPGQKFKFTNTNPNGVTLYGLSSIPFFINNFRFTPPFFIRKKVETIFDEFKPDVIHLQCHFIGRVAVKIAEKRGIPIIATNHFMPDNLIHYVPLPRAIKNRLKEWAWNDLAKIFGKAHHVTTPTETAAKLLQPRLFSKIEAISCGIDLELFNTKKTGGYLYEKYMIPPKPVLLYVGRIDKEKNIDLIIKGVAQALQKIDIHLVIAGMGQESGKLKNLTRELHIENNVTFTGFIPDEDLPNIYNIADCFVIAGIAELQSIVTMEAMASGLPILAVDAVALPELVKHGKNGFLFNKDSIEDLTEHILKIFSDKNARETMGKYSLKIIENHHINKTVSAFEKIYNNALINKV